MFKTMKFLIFLFFFNIIAFVGCKGPSDAEIDNSINTVKAVYTGFFKVLEDNKNNPEIAFKYADEYVENNKSKLIAQGEILGKVGSDKFEVMESFGHELEGIYARSSQNMEPHFATYPMAREKLQELMNRMGKYYTQGIKEASKKK